MTSSDRDVIVDRIAVAELTYDRARGFAEYVASSSDYRLSLDGCGRAGRAEIVAVTVHPPDVPQRPVYDIRYAEPVAVLFRPEPLSLPDILALRGDFPLTPHQLLVPSGWPKALCLFAEPPEELSFRWTASLLAERIVWWLSGTARGALHAQDQRLEHLFAGSVRPIVIPGDAFAEAESEDLVVYQAGSGSKPVFVAVRQHGLVSEARFAFYAMMAAERTHGTMTAEPQTLLDLHQTLSIDGYHFLNDLVNQHLRRDRCKNAVGTIVLVGVPMRREDEGKLEAIHLYAFLCGEKIEIEEVRTGAMSADDLLARLEGPSTMRDTGPARLLELLGQTTMYGSAVVPLINSDPVPGAESVSLEMLVPLQTLARPDAAKLSGRDDNGLEPDIAAIGLGALGSQVFANLARQGFGTWTLIDDDFLSPHNIVRHAVLGARFGQPKASLMANIASEMLAGEAIATAIEANVLRPGDCQKSVSDAFQRATLILDMTGSTAVARNVGIDVHAPARRVSLFMSPSGLDLILLAEGVDRVVRLDLLESQYMRAIMSEPHLEGHMTGGDPVRYGGSCRDLSGRISQEMVGLWASVGSHELRNLGAKPDPSITVWRCSPDTMEVSRIEIPVFQPIGLTTGDWTVLMDDSILENMSYLRETRLPNETCGVLLGSHDMLRHRVYVCAALPPTPDTIEEEGSCVRGTDGLNEKLQAVGEATAGQVSYVGEWHSHPDNIDCLPSPPDFSQLGWGASLMHPDGKPSLMLIIGSDATLAVCLSVP